MKKNKGNGIFLVELCCVVFIVSLIVIMIVLAGSRTIEKNKLDTKLSEEELINKAGEEYIKNNNISIVVGDSISVKLKTLKDMKYLKKAINNSKNESCMENSYVRVYKLNNNEYSYLPYLYCGSEEVKEEVLPTPVAKILFIDGKDENDNSLIFNNINESRIYVELDGGVDNFSRKIEVYAYQMIIYESTKDNPNFIEVYNSGIINTDRKSTYILDKKINSYFNANNATGIKVVVKTVNVLGGVSEVISLAQAN